MCFYVQQVTNEKATKKKKKVDPCRSMTVYFRVEKTCRVFKDFNKYYLLLFFNATRILHGRKVIGSCISSVLFRIILVILRRVVIQTRYLYTCIVLWRERRFNNICVHKFRTCDQATSVYFCDAILVQNRLEHICRPFECSFNIVTSPYR